ncbi:hypothetical protein HDU91_005821 [Kappamyces sp. JEL0680]|nr:hypothetical protein HDU91_005821 [Kappamyces sp. JEL0680]
MDEQKQPSDPYRRLLESHGVAVEFQKVLEIRWCNQKALLQLLGSSCRHSGIIVTSQKVAAAILSAMTLDAMDASWWTVPVYCVGPATRQSMESLGFKLCNGHESENADRLAEYIRDRHPPGPQPLLFLVGDKTRDAIPTVLEEAQLPVARLQLYETTNVAIDSTQLAGKICVLFSPSGLASISTPESLVWISIGPTSQAALAHLGIAAVQASSPSPQGVWDALQSRFICSDQS